MFEVGCDLYFTSILACFWVIFGNIYSILILGDMYYGEVDIPALNMSNTTDQMEIYIYFPYKIEMFLLDLI